MNDMLPDGLEESVITSVVWNTDFAMEIMLQVPVELYSSRQYRTIAKAAYTHLERYQQAPGTHLPEILEKERNNGEQGRLLETIIVRMQEIRDEVQVEYTKDELQAFTDQRTLMKTLEEATDLAIKGKTIEAREKLSTTVAPAQIATPGIWLHEPRFLKFLDKRENEEFFSSGIDLLDQREIRPARKTLMMTVAPKGRGKTWWLISVGRRALENRQKVLHITLEMDEDEVAQRYVQAFFSMTKRESAVVQVQSFRKTSDGSYDGIEVGEFNAKGLSSETRDTIHERMSAKRLIGSANNKRLVIKEFPMTTLTTAGLNAYLELLKVKENFEPDILIIDYANLMHLDTRNLRIDTGRLFRELRGIAQARNIALVTATQGNRESENARSVGSTHVAEDWSSMGTADIVLTISMTDEERERGLARVGVEKARNAPDHWTAYITTNYSIGQFCTDSAFWDRKIEQELSSKSDDGAPRRRGKTPR